MAAEPQHITIASDTQPPLPFEPKLVSDPAIHGGKYVLIFLTTDLESGIDHYEVKEGLLRWERAESPYLLPQQHLPKIILVKAVDRAGNEIQEAVAESVIPHVKSHGIAGAILICALFLVVAGIVSQWNKQHLSK